MPVSINNVSYYSTTPNITGVMNWGSNPNVERYTFTAGLVSNFDPETSTAADYVTELNTNKNTKYVEIINTSSFNANTNAGMAFSENISAGTPKWGSSSKEHPVSIRSGVYGYCVGTNWGSRVGNATKGASSGTVTFRPVIWNNVTQEN